MQALAFNRPGLCLSGRERVVYEMAEKRLIPASLYDDSFFVSLSVQDRYIWIGLLVKIADDQGRLLDNPRLIKAGIFPGDNVNDSDIESALLNFENERKIIRYTTARDQKVIQIIDWWSDYQTSSWIQASKYEAFPFWIDKENINCTYTEALSRQKECPEREIITQKKDKSSCRIERNKDQAGGFPKDFDPYHFQQENPGRCVSRYVSGYLSVCDSAMVNAFDLGTEKVNATTKTSQEEGNDSIAGPGGGRSINLLPKAAENQWIKSFITTLTEEETSLNKEQEKTLLDYFHKVGKGNFQAFIIDCFENSRSNQTKEKINFTIKKINNFYSPLPVPGGTQ